MYYRHMGAWTSVVCYIYPVTLVWDERNVIRMHQTGTTRNYTF